MKKLLLILGMLAIASVASATVVVVDQRLFVTTPSFWEKLSGKTPKELDVVARITNEALTPVRVKAFAAIVTLDDEGRPVPSGDFLKIDPEVTTTYPNAITNFKIRFPISTGQLAFFYVLPVGDEQAQGVKLQTGGGFVLGALWADSYAPEAPIFKLENNHIRVTNRSQFLMRFNLVSMKGEKEHEQTPFFLEPNKTRSFAVSLDADAYLLDWLNGEKRLGLRLR